MKSHSVDMLLKFPFIYPFSFNLDGWMAFIVCFQKISKPTPRMVIGSCEKVGRMGDSQKANYEVKMEILVGRGLQQNIFCGGGIDIIWNHTFQHDKF